MTIEPSLASPTTMNREGVAEPQQEKTMTRSRGWALYVALAGTLGLGWGCGKSTDDGQDIREGDRMKVVDSTGKILTGHDSFDLGCSHGWTTRIV
jgi:hypothetical protein